MKDHQPWHRLPGETDKAYQAFLVYRDIEPSERSIVRTASEMAKSRQHIQRWSSQWNWQERTSAWDEEQDDRLLHSRVEYKRKMDEDHLKIVRAARNHAVKALAEMDLTYATPAEIRYWLEMVLKWERTIVGEPETIVEYREKLAAQGQDTSWPSQDYDLEKEMRELIPIINEMVRDGTLSDEDATGWGYPFDEEGD